jgi:NAD(P)-dependent dehydrogenase (short-subunit alcohol dehydrogenase family)
VCDADFCRQAVERAVQELGKLDILVNNAAHQARKEKLEDITDEEWDRTFQTNIYANFRLTRAALPHFKPGAAVVNTSSETGLEGNKLLLDYSATKGAINAFTKALAQNLASKGVRVNAVAPGPVWTPLNPSDAGKSAEKVAAFGKQAPYGRPAQPEEIAPAYVFLAPDANSSYITGEVLSQMGGGETLVNPHRPGAGMAKRPKEIGVVALAGCRCRCGHEWLPRVPGERPAGCPRCKSPRWDKAKLYERKRADGK